MKHNNRIYSNHLKNTNKILKKNNNSLYKKIIIVIINKKYKIKCFNQSKIKQIISREIILQ